MRERGWFFRPVFSAPKLSAEEQKVIDEEREDLWGPFEPGDVQNGHMPLLEQIKLELVYRLMHIQTEIQYKLKIGRFEEKIPQEDSK